MQTKHDKQLVKLFTSVSDEKLMEDLLNGILTPAERSEIALRLQIVKQLLDGTPQAKIAKNLGVGIATVTRGSRELKQGHFKVLSKKSKITEHVLSWHS